MFTDGFYKVAAGPIAQLTPEEYFDLKREKDPYVGGTAGAAAGIAHGLIRGKKGARSKAGLIHGALGAATGAGAGYLASRAVSNYQANKVYKMTGGLRLKASPGRKAFEGEGESGS